MSRIFWMRFQEIFQQIILVATLILLTTEASLKVSPNSHQKSVLQNTVKAILDFKRLPKPGEVIRPLSKTGNAAAKYMRQLFKEYQGKNGAKLSSAKGNIVRSISPSLGIFKQKYALTFNLHTIKPTEEIISAEIHYNLRTRSSKRQYWKKRQISEIRCVVQTATSEPLELPKLEATANWLSYDARNIVTRTLGEQDSFSRNFRSENKLLGQRFALKFLKVRKNGKKIRSMNPETVLKRHTPFLLVRSNDPILIDKEEVMSAIYDSTPAENDANRVKRSVGQSGNAPQNYYSYHVAEAETNSGEHKGTYENGNEEKLTLHVRAFQSRGPEVLQTRKEMRRNRKIMKKRARKERTRTKTRKNGELPYPEDYEKPPFGVPDIVNLKSNDVMMKEIYDKGLPDHLKNQPTVVLLGGGEEGKGGHLKSNCAKRDLKVEFADIGWAQWIIAPKSFEAHYCSGICPFPLTPETNPSNHATIQSVIHAIGLHPYVPAVCCAPNKMDSLTLLYFDEDDNVVLKNYPQMTVSSCGCL